MSDIRRSKTIDKAQLNVRPSPSTLIVLPSATVAPDSTQQQQMSLPVEPECKEYEVDGIKVTVCSTEPIPAKRKPMLIMASTANSFTSHPPTQYDLRTHW